MKKENGCKKTYVFSLLRVFFLLLVALALPRFFFVNEKLVVTHRYAQVMESSFKLGLENINADFLKTLPMSKKRTIGLITNHTGIDQTGKRNIDLLLEKGFSIKKIFIPEDDLFNYKKTMNQVIVDEQTQIPMSPLSGTQTLKKTIAGAFHDVDILFFDLQDTGISFNGYLNTLVKTLESVAAQSKPLVVLDRPNLLGSSMEGMLTSSFFVNNKLVAIPMRHGMTVGELARHFNQTLAKPAQLYIVPMVNYNRTLVTDASSYYSPTLFTNIDMYYGSSFLAILGTITPLDVGIGTDMAYACLALPESLHFSKQRWYELKSCLKEYGIESSWHRYYNTKKNIYCAGLRLFVRNAHNFSPFNAIMSIIQFFKNAGIKLSFGPECDVALGGKKMRDFLDGKFSRHDLEYEINKGLKEFFHKAHNSFIYKPLPKIVLM